MEPIYTNPKGKELGCVMDADIDFEVGSDVKFRWLVCCDSFYFRAYKAVHLIALSLCQRYCA